MTVMASRTLVLLALLTLGCDGTIDHGTGADGAVGGGDAAPATEGGAGAPDGGDAGLAADAPGTDGGGAGDDAAAGDGATGDGGAAGPILGVYVGNSPDDIVAFETWLGRPVGGILGYTGNASWADYDSSVGWAIGVWSTLDRRVLWSVPLIPTGASLAEAATGAYDSHYLAAAQQLATYRPEEPVLYIRTAWEWNGDWFPWSVETADKIPAFIGAWKKFVDAFRSVSGRFRFDWCPSVGRNPYPWEDAYPGDDYVDVVGIDMYDDCEWSGISDPAARWQWELTRDHGLDWLNDFAAAHGKPMSVAEWGSGGACGDDPTFVQGMHDWVMAHDVLYQTYWDSNAAYTGKLSEGQFPNAAAKYQELFGHP